ncbi:MAG: DUF3006 domain-containing protein [Synergistaceae bacterium]|nr:DUF3006 domain-containing protein [Synergistaceae bacterium]
MEIFLFVDRISDGVATLVYGDGAFTVDMPLCVLPHDTKEGDYIRASFSIDEEKKKRVMDEIDSLMDELGNR